MWVQLPPSAPGKVIGLRSLLQRLKGRRYLWQFYTNVTWDTCEECLHLHGRIVADPTEIPRRDACPREFLRFPVRELPFYREKAQRMREAAQAELVRRELFRRASELLERSPEEALQAFAEASRIELYIPELERFAAVHAAFLKTHPEVRRRLRDICLRAWGAKFTKPRYAPWPERMRLERERWGKERIQEIFGD